MDFSDSCNNTAEIFRVCEKNYQKMDNFVTFLIVQKLDVFGLLIFIVQHF